jgi:hypothetical protein
MKPDINRPSTAVLRVPKGKFRSETGSQTNISPSNIMLEYIEIPVTVMGCYEHSLVYPAINGRIDVGCQAASSNMFSIQVCVVFPLSVIIDLVQLDHIDKTLGPRTIEIFIPSLMQLQTLAVKFFLNDKLASLHLFDRVLDLTCGALAKHGRKGTE